MSFVDKLKRAEQCEDALRKIIEAMRQRYIPLGGADKAELDDIVVLARKVLHEPLFQIGQKVRVETYIEIEVDGEVQKFPGPFQGTVRDIDVRKDCAIYHVALDNGHMFLWNDVTEKGQLAADTTPEEPAAAKTGLLKLEHFIKWSKDKGLDTAHDGSPKTVFVSVPTQWAWAGWRAAIIHRLVDDILGDPDDAEDDSSEEEKKRSYMIKTEGGKSFRCVCGCNVFHKKKPKVRPAHYTCNACDETYTGEKV